MWKTSYINFAGARDTDDRVLAENAGSPGLVSLLLHTLSVVMHGCNPNRQEVEEGGREVQGQPQLYRELKAS